MHVPGCVARVDLLAPLVEEDGCYILQRKAHIRVLQEEWMEGELKGKKKAEAKKKEKWGKVCRGSQGSHFIE